MVTPNTRRQPFNWRTTEAPYPSLPCPTGGPSTDAYRLAGEDARVAEPAEGAGGKPLGPEDASRRQEILFGITGT